MSISSLPLCIVIGVKGSVEWKALPNQSPFFTGEGSALCSRVPQRGSVGVLAPPPPTKHKGLFLTFTQLNTDTRQQQGDL